MAQQSDAYPAFTSAWNTGTLPANTTGTALTGQTTAQKLININGWVNTGSIPTALYSTGDQIANCINWGELNALTAAQRSDVLGLCGIPGQLLGGSANTSLLTAGMIIAYFPTKAITSGTYNNATGVVTLTMPASVAFGVGVNITINGITGTGAFATLGGVVTTISPTSGTTVTYNAGAGHGASTITGGSVTSATVTALTALAKATPQPWWQFISALRPFDMGDVAACGVS